MFILNIVQPLENYFQQDKILVELLQNDFWTNALLILNIVVSFSAATFIKIRIDKKAKEFEVKAHIKKISAEKIIQFCLRANKSFRVICSKNPKSISTDELHQLNELVIAEELLFINNESETNIKEFRDYILTTIENIENKDIRKEKSFFFLLKKILDDI